ncbi:MAG: imidazole glycerol phosphate synthase subunit HisH [Calditrichia bacterium]|nr:imidazole glycerol phosphate synthase subunit HisH [Calditrichia bacterium]
MIGIIDYGAGNLRSVRKALDFLEVESRILHSAADFSGLEKVILPGVGAFQAAVDKLREYGMEQPVLDWIAADKPFLGICVGMQVLFDSGAESPGAKGLGVFAGEVPKFDHHKVPQIGWNRLNIRKASPLLNGIPDGSYFYFLHSFYCKPADPDVIIAETDYGITYTAIVQRGNVFAVQFHPEKSAENGLKLLKNWIEL